MIVTQTGSLLPCFARLFSRKRKGLSAVAEGPLLLAPGLSRIQAVAKLTVCVTDLRHKAGEQRREDHPNDERQDKQRYRNSPGGARAYLGSRMLQSLYTQPQTVKRQDADRAADYKERRMLCG
jgi:hypothetical protein